MQIEKFANAMKKGLEYVHTHTSIEIANIIQGSVPSTSLETVSKVVERYKSIDARTQDLMLTEEGFNKLYSNALLFGYKIVETCGEPDFESTPCLSQKDIDILGLTDKIILKGNKEQRTHCSCPSNKRQLITWEKSRIKCGHNCLYCYMKDNK